MREGQIRAQWCVDSESGRVFLIDLDKQTILAEKVNGRLVDPNPLEPPPETPSAT